MRLLRYRAIHSGKVACAAKVRFARIVRFTPKIARSEPALSVAGRNRGCGVCNGEAADTVSARESAAEAIRRPVGHGLVDSDFICQGFVGRKTPFRSFIAEVVDGKWRTQKELNL